MAPTLSTDIQLNRVEGKEFVVLCIGESTTDMGRAGGMKPLWIPSLATHSWPSQLQRILNSIQDEKTFRVINRGVPGTHTSSILRHLPEYLDKYKPDIVLAMVGINDYCKNGSPYCDNFGDFELIPIKNSSSRFRWATFLNSLRTYGLIEWIADGIKTRLTGTIEDMELSNVGGGNDTNGNLPAYFLRDPNVTELHPQTIRNLNDMVDLTTNHGINFVFVQYALRKVDILRNSIERDAFYISNYEVFVDMLKQYDYDDLFIDHVAGNFGHATPFGNRIIANNVAQQLLKYFESQE